MFKSELVSPAGTLKKMRYAFAYGADAVYAGQPRYSLRVRNNEFDHRNLQLGIQEAHMLGKKFYVVVNIVPHNAKLRTFIHDLTPIIKMEPDALIISDPGLIMLVRENFPEMKIHLSVQANAVNWATVKFWQKMGLTRAILSRELSLEEIEEIRNHVPEMELEIFVHGALCMAYSGRCLLSSYISKRDSNQGACTNVCRWEYNVKQYKANNTEDVILHKCKPISETAFMHNIKPAIDLSSSNQLFMIKEMKNSDDHMLAFEDEHGTYIMNSKDLRAIKHIAHLMQIGVHSLKIEGRTKSFYYCARTAQAYRKAIDDAIVGRPFDPMLLESLEGLANRGYTEGFLRRHTHDEYQNYEYGYSVSKRQQFVGEFTGERKKDLAAVLLKNKFSIGDYMELLAPQGNIKYILKYMENDKGEAMSVAPGDGYIVWIPVPKGIHLQYALLVRNLEATNIV